MGSDLITHLSSAPKRHWVQQKPVKKRMGPCSFSSYPGTWSKDASHIYCTTQTYSPEVAHERSVCDVPNVARLLSRDSIASCSAASAADPSSTLPRVAPMAPLCPLLGYGRPLGLDSASCKLFDPAGMSDGGCDWCWDKEQRAAAWSARNMALWRHCVAKLEVD